ncbi:MAG: nicotinate phosphoribosyltransferase [Lachnospiraceae bacterium]|nr:nicotinate phosphoribosyltransferase [Lachnospiraceae bacterium]
MKKTIYDERNIAMMMDLYELTMANGYFLQEDQKRRVAFDVFYRKNPDNGGFAVFAGLEQILQYLEGLHFGQDDVDYLRSLNMFDDRFLDYLLDFKFTGDVYAFPEGTVMYPGEPLITVVADLVQAQIIETELLAQINHQSLVATKACRIVRAAGGRAVSDFGARRAHNNDAAIYGARACYIGGVNGTATVSAGQDFDIPVSGTMAHSWVMFYRDELTAFRKFAEIYPNNCILLVDTYDVLKSGVPNAIRVFEEMQDKGITSANFGIRLDSGDLAYLSRKARRMLDEAGFHKAKIVVSNSLDEYTIRSIIDQGGRIDAFGVGERMITARSEPVFGAVYKLCAVEDNGVMQPRIKISENVEKVTNPGLKKVFRAYNKEGHSIADVLARYDETPENCEYLIDPDKPWKKIAVANLTFKELQKCMMKDGKRTGEPETMKTIRERLKAQLDNEVWEEEQRFENPHWHYLDMTPAYYNEKLRLLEEESRS